MDIKKGIFDGEQSKRTFDRELSKAEAHLNSLINHVDNVINGGLEIPGPVITLLKDYKIVASVLFEQYTGFLLQDKDLGDESIPAHLHRMIEKLSQEWSVVMQTVWAAVSGEAYITRLEPVIKWAAKDAGLEHVKFVALPYFGDRFALTQFQYSKDFAALGIPIFDLDNKIEWSVIWHEMAEYKMMRLEQQKAQYKKSFDEQLKEILDAYPEVFKNTNHIKEIFADAHSVLAFGKSFIDTLDHILQRYYEDATSEEETHPPRALRIRLCRLILEAEPSNRDDPDEFRAAQAIKKLLRSTGSNPTSRTWPLDPESPGQLPKTILGEENNWQPPWEANTWEELLDWAPSIERGVNYSQHKHPEDDDSDILFSRIHGKKHKVNHSKIAHV